MIEKNLSPKKDQYNKFIEQIGNEQHYMFSGEVIDVILDNKHPLYNNDSNIGSIYFETFKGITGWAKPLNIRDYELPYKNETVLILSSNTISSGTVNDAKGYYYLTNVTIWNLVNMNFMPGTVPTVTNNLTTYQQSEQGFPNQQKVFKPKLKTTNEKLKIQSYIPYEGDKLIQGRWGNIIRLSSTQKNKINEWSTDGPTGEPIIIIKVDNKETEFGEYKIDDIKTDKTSIYICSNQKLPLETNSGSSFQISQRHIALNEYKGPQIVFMSDRLALVSRKDIILNANNQLTLYSKNNLNIDGKNVYIGSESNIYIGGNSRHVAVAESLISIMTKLLTALSTLTVLCTAPGTPSSPPINMTIFESIKSELQMIKSSNVFLK